MSTFDADEELGDGLAAAAAASVEGEGLAVEAMAARALTSDTRNPESVAFGGVSCGLPDGVTRAIAIPAPMAATTTTARALSSAMRHRRARD
jgi:hypothetical protein